MLAFHSDLVVSFPPVTLCLLEYIEGGRFQSTEVFLWREVLAEGIRGVYRFIGCCGILASVLEDNLGTTRMRLKALFSTCHLLGRGVGTY